MILSLQQLFSNKQAITLASNVLSTNVIDLGVAGTPHGGKAPLNRDIGKGAKVPLLVQVTTDFGTSAGCTAVIFNLETGSTTALNTIIASQTVLIADLVEGFQISLDYLPNGIVERYIGMSYECVTGAADAGNVTAGISMGNQTNVTGA